MGSLRPVGQIIALATALAALAMILLFVVAPAAFVWLVLFNRKEKTPE